MKAKRQPANRNQEYRLHEEGPEDEDEPPDEVPIVGVYNCTGAGEAGTS